MYPVNNDHPDDVINQGPSDIEEHHPQTNPTPNVERPSPIPTPRAAVAAPLSPPKNVNMMVLGGFIAALGMSAVTYALIALHAPFLVTACVVVLGMAATYAGVRFFSHGANPPTPPPANALTPANAPQSM